MYVNAKLIFSLSSKSLKPERRSLLHVLSPQEHLVGQVMTWSPCCTRIVSAIADQPAEREPKGRSNANTQTLSHCCMERIAKALHKYRDKMASCMHNHLIKCPNVYITLTSGLGGKNIMGIQWYNDEDYTLRNATHDTQKVCYVHRLSSGLLNSAR